MVGFKYLVLGTLAALALATDARAQADAAPGIEVLQGSFGAIGKARKVDLVAPLRALCAGSATRCETFCSETSFGRWRLGSKPICRVTYRCPDGDVRATEAAAEELLRLDCPPPALPEVAEAAPAPIPPAPL